MNLFSFVLILRIKEIMLLEWSRDQFFVIQDPRSGEQVNFLEPKAKIFNRLSYFIVFSFCFPNKRMNNNHRGLWLALYFLV